MSKRTAAATATAATNGLSQALKDRVPMDDLLARLGQRDRVNIERHLAACTAESDPRHAAVWQRLLQALGTLAPLAASTTGQTAVSFFVADGKYRMQVFAIEDNRDGKVLIYAPDILTDAVATGILSASQRGDAPGFHRLASDPDQTIAVEVLNATNTPNPANFYKHMLGWNRKAIRIALPVDASEEQLTAAELLCALAAKQWAAKVAG